jgi:hypothetical protein
MMNFKQNPMVLFWLYRQKAKADGKAPIVSILSNPNLRSTRVDISGTETDTGAAAFGTSAGEYIRLQDGSELVGFTYYQRTLIV